MLRACVNGFIHNYSLIGKGRHRDNRIFCLWCHFEILPRQITKKRVARVFRITYYRFMKCPFPIPLSILTYGQIKHDMMQNSQVNYSLQFVSQCKPLRHLNTFHSGQISKNLFLTICMGFGVSFRIIWRFWTSGGLAKTGALWEVEFFRVQHIGVSCRMKLIHLKWASVTKMLQSLKCCMISIYVVFTLQH